MGSAEQSQTATPDLKNPHDPDPAMHDHSCDDESEPGPSILGDDGSRRCRLRWPLRCCPEAFIASGQELEESANAAKVKGKGKRKRNKGKSVVRAGRGLGMPRNPQRPEDRPILRPVADGVFATTPDDKKYITTLRLLNLENMPGPYRSYNFFPSRIRLEILKQFLQRYSWDVDEDIGRCLDVFENIAAEAYSRELAETQSLWIRKHGADKAKWKEIPPKWCKNIEA